MIVVFTSAAFADWVANHVTQGADAAFNPYLTFLFYALYVSLFLLLYELNVQMITSAGLSAIRFLGSLLYLVFRLFGF